MNALSSSYQGRAGKDPRLAQCECPESRGKLHRSGHRDLFSVERRSVVVCMPPGAGGGGLMALKKVLAKEILDGTDRIRRDIIKIVKIGEQWHQK